MTCNKCGAELEEGVKFCLECGQTVPQTKSCIQCGEELPIKAKFCGECGTRQDGSATATSTLAMGDKNVVAGDVIGTKEETRIAGNATIIKNEDGTKKTDKCHVCGKWTTVVGGYECKECHNFICPNCFSEQERCCLSCSQIKSSSLMETERRILKKSYDLLYVEEKPTAALTLLEPLYHDHQNNTEVLNLYLPTLARCNCQKAEQVGATVKHIQGYKIQVECAIKKGNLIQAERKLQEAKQLWPTSGTIALLEVILKIVQYRDFAEIELLEQGKQLLQEIGELKDPTEKTWYYVVKTFLFNAEDKNNPILEKSFFTAEGLYWTVVQEFFQLIFKNEKCSDNKIDCGLDENTHKLFWRCGTSTTFEYYILERKMQEKNYNSYDELKSVTEYEYDSHGNKVRKKEYFSDGELKSVTEYEYDSHGNKVRKKEYFSDGELKSVTEYEYDSHENKVQEKVYNSYDDLAIEYEYDSYGNKVRGKGYYLGGKLRDIFEYEYDSQGNKIREKRYDSDGKLERVWEYDSQGNEIRGKRYNSDGKLERVWEYEYDSQGNEIRGKSYNSDGKLESVTEYEYDSQGNKIREKLYNSDGKLEMVWEYEYEYDSHGNEIRKKRYNSDGKLVWEYEYEYDSHGNKVRKKEYEYNGMLWCEHEYDSCGNLIREKYYDIKGKLNFDSLNLEWRKNDL